MVVVQTIVMKGSGALTMISFHKLPHFIRLCHLLLTLHKIKELKKQSWNSLKLKLNVAFYTNSARSKYCTSNSVFTIIRQLPNNIQGISLDGDQWKYILKNTYSYTPPTLRACCSQSKFRILKICESGARASVCKLRKKIWASAGCPVLEIWTSAKDFGYP